MKLRTRIGIAILMAFILSLSFAPSIYTSQAYASSYRTLRVGSRGSDVSSLQRALSNRGYSVGSVDGVYGQRTKNAVISFQRNNNLTVDGIAGSQTQSALYTSIATRNTSNSYKLLKLGSRGSSVSSLQRALNTKGYSVGVADGVYGPKTKNAVIRFQRANDLTVDGIAGSQTQSVLYSSRNASVSSRGTSYAREYSSTDLYWLSRIIHAEAQAEPYSGKVAVGNVIINRVNSNLFPNTIKGVIFDYFKGIPQFSPVANGTIYNTPSQESIQAAKDSLNGVRPVGSCTYFFNPDIASGGDWIVENKTFVKRIGDHDFYK